MILDSAPTHSNGYPHVLCDHNPDRVCCGRGGGEGGSGVLDPTNSYIKPGLVVPVHYPNVANKHLWQTGSVMNEFTGTVDWEKFASSGQWSIIGKSGLVQNTWKESIPLVMIQLGHKNYVYQSRDLMADCVLKLVQTIVPKPARGSAYGEYVGIKLECIWIMSTILSIRLIHSWYYHY